MVKRVNNLYGGSRSVLWNRESEDYGKEGFAYPSPFLFSNNDFILGVNVPSLKTAFLSLLCSQG